MFTLFLSHIYKLKRMPIIWLALLCPTLLSLTLVWYYSFAPWEAESKASGYFQAMGILLPLFIGFLSIYLSEQERAAGGFFNILSLKSSRLAQFWALYLEIVLLVTLSCTLAIFIFALLWGQMITVAYVFTSCLFFVAVPCLVMLQLMCALRFGSSFAAAASTSFMLISALAVAGLFAGIWYALPPAWPPYFSGFMIYDVYHPEQTPQIAAMLRLGLLFCVIESILSFVLVPLWFARWDGSSGKAIE